MTKKQNIFLIGPSGTGKSTIGKLLSKQLNMNFFDSDTEIIKKTKTNINSIFDLEGESGFRKKEKKIINKIIKNEKIILSTGGGAIKTKETCKNLQSNGIVIFLYTTIQKQILRIQYDETRPLLRNKKNLKKILKTMNKERNHIYKKIADFIIYTDNYNPKTISNKIIKIIKNI